MSEDLLARHHAVMPDWMALYYEEPLELVSGSGRRVLGSDGVEYLDFFGGLLATMIGHSIPEISDAVASQAHRIMHSSTLYLISSQVELAEKIAAVAPVDDPRVFFVNSGSEAVETALALATSQRKSNQVLALRGSYHGRSFATVGVTGIRAWSATPLSPLQVSYVHSGYRLRSPFRDLNEADFVAACKEELQTIIETSTAGRIAAFLYEPVQGAGGFATPPVGFFRAMKEVLDPYEVPFISDEVQSGWGRTGAAFFATEHFGIRPQMITFAKGLANGLSIGGVVGEAAFVNAAEANSISTAGGNPVAMSAANAVLDYIRDHDLQRNADAMGRRLRDGLATIARRYPLIGEVRGMGLMIGVELVGADGFSRAVTETTAVLEAARREQLLIGRGGLYGNVLRITPPMTVTAAEVDEALDKLERAIASVAAVGLNGLFALA
ncbi:aspartate aminotransferase family protein [Agromyces badenianii]|uniref:aspartate aminotransferase family protein n=1 Tax=Agromyces badenianii TaxID=2080742 RepID=UPI000D59DFE6|nr:aspartate aminotransferase family protein [Agromyces badenianii]PWC05588.1 aspartate aminotransferase family protein [Agromyces badenianii]